MEVESRLVPILREGVDVVKMIFFRRLKDRLAEQYPDEEIAVINKLSGAVINEVFGTPNSQEAFVSFVKDNRDRIRGTLERLATDLSDLRIPITDALRITFLCDHHEGHGDPELLSRANELGMLIVDRDIPMPAKFMNLVRQLGGAYNLIIAPIPESPEQGPSASG